MWWSTDFSAFQVNFLTPQDRYHFDFHDKGLLLKNHFADLEEICWFEHLHRRLDGFETVWDHTT
jgi:hypothetical protein